MYNLEITEQELEFLRKFANTGVEHLNKVKRGSELAVALSELMSDDLPDDIKEKLETMKESAVKVKKELEMMEALKDKLDVVVELEPETIRE